MAEVPTFRLGKSGWLRAVKVGQALFPQHSPDELDSLGKMLTLIS